MADGTRILYDALKADGFTDLPDYNTFNTALKDKGKREEVHQRLTRMYEDTPKDFESFDQFLGVRNETAGEAVQRIGGQALNTAKGVVGAFAAGAEDVTGGISRGLGKLIPGTDPFENFANSQKAYRKDIQMDPDAPKYVPQNTFEGAAKQAQSGDILGAVGQAVGASLEAGASSVPGMAVMAIPGAGAPAFWAAQTENMATTRAQNEGKAAPDAKDYAVAAPSAAIQAALEKIGIKGLSNNPFVAQVTDGLATKLGKVGMNSLLKGLQEGSTEALQQVAQYTTEVAGTNVKFDTGELARQAVTAAAGGFAVGGALGTVEQAIPRRNTQVSNQPSQVAFGSKKAEQRYSSLNPTFKTALESLADDYYQVTGKNLRVNHAVRTTQEQADIYNSGVRPAAKPGTSRHEKGLAVDIDPKQAMELNKLGLLEKHGLENLGRIGDFVHIQFSKAGKARAAQPMQQAADMLPDNVRAQVEAEAEDIMSIMPDTAPSQTENQTENQTLNETPSAMQFTEAQPTMSQEQIPNSVMSQDATVDETNQVQNETQSQIAPGSIPETQVAITQQENVNTPETQALREAGNVQGPAEIGSVADLHQANRPEAGTQEVQQADTQEATKKEPWQMTKAEDAATERTVVEGSRFKTKQEADAEIQTLIDHIRNTPAMIATVNQAGLKVEDLYEARKIQGEWRVASTHKQKVAAAIREGKPVPEEVLAEYPGLQSNLGRPGASTTQELRSKQYEEHAGLAARSETIRQESGAEPRPRTPFYEVIPNDATVHQAKALSEGYTTEEIISAVQDMNNNIAPHVRVAMGELVIKRLSKEYKTTKNEAILEQQNDIFDWMMNYAEKTGRTLQAFSLFKSLTPEGVLHTFKRTVKKARDRHYDDNKPDVDEILDVANDKTKTPGEKKQKLDELSKFISKFKPGNKVARQLRPLWAKIVEAGRVGALSKEEFYNQVAGKLKLPMYDEATAQRIMDLGAKIEASNEGIQQERAIAELNKFLAHQSGFSVIDLPLGIYYGNILSGYNTSLVNIADTFLNVLAEVNTMAIANPRAAAFIYSRWIRGYAEGRFDAVLAWTDGRQTSDGKWFEASRLMDVAEFGKKGGVPIIAKGAASKFIKFLAESKLATPLNAWKYVTRLLSLQDVFQWRAASEARSAQLAFRMAEQQGLKGQAAIDKARDILALNDMQALGQEAMREGFTGRDIQARALEIRAALRPVSINTDAADFAGEATYNHKPHGLLGAVAQQANVLSGKYPGIKFIVPFTRIVANVTNRKLDWTPYGFKRAFKGYSLAEPLTGEQRQAMLIRATVGTSAMAAAAALSAAGLMTIHGNGPDDKERRRQMMSAGWKPFTIEVGGAYYSYINTPLGLGFSIVGNMADMERYGTGDAWDIGKRGAYATLMVGSTIFSQSFLSSTATLFEALSGDNPGMSISSALSMMSRTAAGLVTPNIIRDVNTIFDPKLYRGDDLMSIMLQNTPFAAASGAKPLLNALGSPVEKVGSRFHSVKTTDPVWRMLIDKGVKVAVPGKTVEIDTENHIRMTPDQYYRYYQMQGLELYDYINSNLSEYEGMNNDAVQEDINDWGKKNRKEILNQIREEYKQNGAR